MVVSPLTGSGLNVVSSLTGSGLNGGESSLGFLSKACTSTIIIFRQNFLIYTNVKMSNSLLSSQEL